MKKSKCGAVSKSLENLNGRPIVLNASFNIRGQPIVETPLEAISTFAGNGIDYLIMGTPDFRKYKFGPKLDSQYVAYCYQSLLEDGRISKKDMFNFYDSLKKWAKKYNKKVVIKVHPVADKKYLDILKNKYGFELEYKLIPNTDIVIGHYSSLLPFWGINNRKVICVKLPGHNIDESIGSWATVVKELSEINNINNIKTNVNLCRYYFDFPISIEILREKFFKEKIL